MERGSGSGLVADSAFILDESRSPMRVSVPTKCLVSGHSKRAYDWLLISRIIAGSVLHLVAISA